MNKRKSPGELELQVLSQLQRVQKATVAEIEKSFHGSYAYTTIMTVLSRMHAKKLVTRSKEGRQYVYAIKNAQSHSLLDRIKKRLFGNKTAGMIQYLIESSDKLSPKELQEIEKLIQKCKNES